MPFKIKSSTSSSILMVAWTIKIKDFCEGLILIRLDIIYTKIHTVYTYTRIRFLTIDMSVQFAHGRYYIYTTRYSEMKDGVRAVCFLAAGCPDQTKGRAALSDCHSCSGNDWVSRCSHRSSGWVWNRWPWWVKCRHM